MSGTIIKITDLDLKKVSFSEPITNSYGGVSVVLRYGGQPLMIQTPKMRLPFGLGKYEDKDDPTQVKYSMDMSFAGYELGSDDKPLVPAIRSFYEKLAELDNMLIEAAYKNKDLWFPTLKSKFRGKDENVVRGVIDANHRPSIRESKRDPDRYPPTVKTNIREYADKKTGQKVFAARFFDDDRNQIENILEFNLPKQSEAIAILRVKVTFTQDKYGFAWDINQVRLFPAKTLPTYGFLDDEDDDKPVVTNFKELADDDQSDYGSRPSGKTMAVVSNYVKDEVDELDEKRSPPEEEEDEEDPEDEEEEEPLPPKPRTPSPPPPPPKATKKTSSKK